MREPADQDPPSAAAPPRWQSALSRLASQEPAAEDRLGQLLSDDLPDAPLSYAVNVQESRLRDQLVVDLLRFEEGRKQPCAVDDRGRGPGVGEADQARCRLLLGNAAEGEGSAYQGPGARFTRSAVRPGMVDLVLPALADSGRLRWLDGEDSGQLAWDEGEAFVFSLKVSPVEEGFSVDGALRRGEERLALSAPSLLLSGGLMLLPGEAARLCRMDAEEHLDWMFRLRRQGGVMVPRAAQDAFLVHLSTIPNLPEVELPPELHWSHAKIAPRPAISFAIEDTNNEDRFVIGRVSFLYGDKTVLANGRQTVVADAQGRQLFSRDLSAERAAVARLGQLGLSRVDGSDPAEAQVKLPAAGLREAVRQLVAEGWRVDADEVTVKSGGQLKVKVSSGIDWFDLEGAFELDDGSSASLPEILRAARAGSALLSLSDGTKALAPEWLGRYAQLARLTKERDGGLRFLPSQAGIIDALLTGHAETTVDVKFQRLRESLAEPPGPVKEPEGFTGRLRSYQREGLAWLRSLEAHGYGGCLADDMGLGKTVQVLALLQGRHRPGGRRPAEPRPSLIVVPRSLIQNWIQEAKKFAPDLTAVDYTGASRLAKRDKLTDYDLVVTTYGTLRQDILHLLEVPWQTVILDEAQAIKNPRSQAAKACRLVPADHRLAISGTPIENSLEELWSLFEFLNPGMLGALEDFSSAAKIEDEEWLSLLSRTLRPFMLRRDKRQVLTELPEKTEKHLYIDLGPEDRKAYDELRRYYQAALTSKIEEVGYNQAKIQVLEALLRLRQASCHPGLIDPRRRGEPSSKLDQLYEMLTEVTGTGHKALVFSQFTTLLQIVADWLKAEGIDYEYLDGGTRDRQGGVERFQEDENKKVFLISLKAGGVGLTLTASDYVFLLDPWWNPAVEAQAIDRAYRMGQKNPVFAYRLIARDTVEEKIVKLQDEKRKLAEAVVTGGGGSTSLSDLSMEDIQQLLAD